MLNTSMHGITARQIKSLISESDNKLLYATRGGGGMGRGVQGASLLTQCLTINVLHMLLSLFLLLQIMLFNYPLSFYLQMRLQYFIYELTIVISNG